MDALFIAELNERLFTHFTGGVWRAPHSLRLMPVFRASGERFGQIACADARDLERARAGLRHGAAGQEHKECGHRGLGGGNFARALEGRARALSRLRDAEGFGAETVMAMPLPRLEASGPWILMSSAAMPVSILAAALIAGAGTGMIWKPAPAAAASAHLIMGVLGPLSGGRLAMVHGDHETGAALARLGPLLWASDDAPPAALPSPALTLGAGSQARP